MKEDLRELLKKCWDSGRSYGANMSSNNFNDFLNSLEALPKHEAPRVRENEETKELNKFLEFADNRRKEDIEATNFQIIIEYLFNG
jgi:hypothetical protein